MDDLQKTKVRKKLFIIRNNKHKIKYILMMFKRKTLHVICF